MRGSMMSVAPVASIAFVLALSLAQIPALTRYAVGARTLERQLIQLQSNADPAFGAPRR